MYLIKVKSKQVSFFFSESLKWKQNSEKSLEWLNPSNMLLDCPTTVISTVPTHFV